ncbi:hypothetical protein JOQ06_000388, partial [Pogonophryne albipinna]
PPPPASTLNSHHIIKSVVFALLRLDKKDRSHGLWGLGRLFVPFTEIESEVNLCHLAAVLHLAYLAVSAVSHTNTHADRK